MKNAAKCDKQCELQNPRVTRISNATCATGLSRSNGMFVSVSPKSLNHRSMRGKLLRRERALVARNVVVT